MELCAKWREPEPESPTDPRIAVHLGPRVWGRLVAGPLGRWAAGPLVYRSRDTEIRTGLLGGTQQELISPWYPEQETSIDSLRGGCSARLDELLLTVIQGCRSRLTPVMRPSC